MYYAGIGSRKTPDGVCIVFEQLGNVLAGMGFVLRSGHADGADIAFEDGCDSRRGSKEIWLPWRWFNGSDSPYIVKEGKAFTIAESIHPAWDRCTDSAKKLHARNSHQILGIELNEPVQFVCCYTERGSGKGGTGQAIRLARMFKVPVFDAGAYTSLETYYQDVLSYARSLLM